MVHENSKSVTYAQRGLFFLTGLAFAFVYVMVTPIIPRLEGKYYPVVEDVLVVADQRLEMINGRPRILSRLTGDFKKLRECAFIKLEWYVGTPDRGALVPIEFLAGSKDRGEGIHDYGPWDVFMTPQQVEKSVAIVTHRCHPFWVTETVFWNSVDGDDHPNTKP